MEPNRIFGQLRSIQWNVFRKFSRGVGIGGSQYELTTKLFDQKHRTQSKFSYCPGTTKYDLAKAGFIKEVWNML